MKLQRFAGSADWSALYVDGKLDRVGDHYLIDERIAELAEVEECSSDAFLKGGDYREHALGTAEEVFAHIREQELREEKAAELEAQSRELQEQAKKMRESA